MVQVDAQAIVAYPIDDLGEAESGKLISDLEKLGFEMPGLGDSAQP